jgi:hypothetical protein
MLGIPVASGHPGPLRRFGQAVRQAATGAARPWTARRRPWWKWVLIAVLLAGTLAVTAVYAATLARDLAQQHWAAAVDASREAVLAVVGWTAVIIVLSAEDTAKRAVAQPHEGAGTGERPDESAPGADSVLQAQERVRRLRVRLAELGTARQRAGSGADRDLDREVASTVARLEQARQWLTSAQSALATSRAGAPQRRRTTRHTRPSASLVGRRQYRAQDFLGGIGRDARGQYVRVRLVQVT